MGECVWVWRFANESRAVRSEVFPTHTLAPVFWVNKYFSTPKINDKFLSTCVHQLGGLHPADEPTVDAQVRFEPNPTGELHAVPALGIITFVFRESKKG